MDKDTYRSGFSWSIKWIRASSMPASTKIESPIMAPKRLKKEKWIIANKNPRINKIRSKYFNITRRRLSEVGLPRARSTPATIQWWLSNASNPPTRMETETLTLRHRPTPTTITTRIQTAFVNTRVTVFARFEKPVESQQPNLPKFQSGKVWVLSPSAYQPSCRKSNRSTCKKAK